MKVVFGNDHYGLHMKELLLPYVQSLGFEVHNIGTDSNEPVDYPDIAEELALRIISGDFDRGILICGTGIGMAIVANKVTGIRAAQIYDIYTAECAAKSNDANVISLGAQVIGPESAKLLVQVWLQSEFAAGRSARKVQKIQRIDEKHRSDVHLKLRRKKESPNAGAIDWKELTPPDDSE
ncbi:MAG: ribose 5-phosphate isomerase B [Anaerolineales bacterium]|nr:ribose 5-phosphate isomerase B [Anaerolineales bacterium]